MEKTCVSVILFILGSLVGGNKANNEPSFHGHLSGSVRINFTFQVEHDVFEIKRNCSYEALRRKEEKIIQFTWTEHVVTNRTGSSYLGRVTRVGDGRTEFGMEINDLKYEDAGHYCYKTTNNSSNLVFTQSFVVDVEGPSEMYQIITKETTRSDEPLRHSTSQPENHTPYDGEIVPSDHDYTCNARCQPPCEQYTWIDNSTGDEIGEGKTIKIKDERPLTSLICRASNHYGMIEIPFTICKFMNSLPLPISCQLGSKLEWPPKTPKSELLVDLGNQGINPIYLLLICVFGSVILLGILFKWKFGKARPCKKKADNEGAVEGRFEEPGPPEIQLQCVEDETGTKSTCRRQSPRLPIESSWSPPSYEVAVSQRDSGPSKEVHSCRSSGIGLSTEELSG